jgi:hypothetical protein
MAPEAPGNLIVVDSRFRDQELAGYVESVEYAPEQRERIEATGGWFYVLWNERPKEADYVSLGGGVVYVNKKELPSGYKISPKSPIVLDPLGDGRYAYSYPALGEGLMFVLILPEDYTLTDSRPVPKSAKILREKRLAVYWKPDGKYGAPVKVVWQIRNFDGDLKFERNRINADIERSENVPDNPGVIVGEPVRRADTRSNMTVPSWFAKAGFASAGVAFLFLIILVAMAMFGRDVPSSARVLVDIATAIAIACAFTFIGGTAQAEGKLPLFKGDEPIKFATTGGIAVFVIALGILLWSYR